MAGWVLHDLAVFLTQGWPPLALELLPGSGVAILVGALLGWIAGRLPWAFLAMALAMALASLAPLVTNTSPSPAQAWLPRTILVVMGTIVAGAWTRRVIGSGSLRTGLALGVLACLATFVFRLAMFEVSWMLLGLAVMALLVGIVRRPTVRWTGTFLALVLGAGWITRDVRADLQPTRADLEPPGAGPWPGAPSVLLVVLDTVRADHLAPYGYERVTTPNLDAFVAEHATRYARSHSTSSWTLPSHASLFTGLLPSEHGAAPSGMIVRGIRDDVQTLAERLRDVGFRTAAIAANNVFLRPRFGLDRGFERFDDRASGLVHTYLPLAQLGHRNPHVGHLTYRDANTITGLALKWLDDHEGETFFLMLNYMDAHVPLIPPPPFDEAFADDRPASPRCSTSPRLLKLLYDRELLYLDSQLGRLLDGLRSRGILEGTLIVVTSDHGEALGDHDFLYHGHTLYEELTWVPLYVKPARGRRVEVIDEPVTGAEVFGLILSDLNIERGAPERPVDCEFYQDPDWIPPPKGWWTGKLRNVDVWRDLVSWIEGDVKTIVSSKGVVEAFDLVRDPCEATPLTLSPQATESALERARLWWSQHPLETADTPKLGEAQLDRMRAHGYLGGG